MMVLALGQTVWVAVGEAEVPLLVERITRAEDKNAPETVVAMPPARIMPAPAPLAMPLQEF